MIGALACLPWLLKRWQQRQQAARNVSGISAQVLASVSVGPSQRVVTVEVGQGTQKACLVLGVTAQNIQCLHVLGQAAPTPPASQSFAGAMAHVQAQGQPPQS
ncbi:MAG TPA: flagellar biosynthetic protein FliO [Comamonas sp.]|nr:flagellar biosynthetic protein FliO [Comamonas sp. NoAH]